MFKILRYSYHSSLELILECLLDLLPDLFRLVVVLIRNGSIA